MELRNASTRLEFLRTSPLFRPLWSNAAMVCEQRTYPHTSEGVVYAGSTLLSVHVLLEGYPLYTSSSNERAVVVQAYCKVLRRLHRLVFFCICVRFASFRCNFIVLGPRARRPTNQPSARTALPACNKRSSHQSNEPCPSPCPGLALARFPRTCFGTGTSRRSTGQENHCQSVE